MGKYKIERTFEDVNPLSFKLTFPEGKSLSDVNDVIFIVKPKDDSPYSEVLIEKTLLGGDISTSGTRYFIVAFETADYTNLVIGNSYRAALFCKWDGETDFDESVEQIFDFEIIQNFHNS